MKTLIYLFTLISLACWNSSPSLAEQESGPATLENLITADEGKEPPATTEAKATHAAPKRPAGTTARPNHGVQHPVLDNAWAEYEAAVGKVADVIRAAISKQFDTATAKGDLDAAEKWLTIGENFEKAGELPTENEIKVTVSAAVADYKKAREELTKGYESVVKALTMEKKIAEAKAARNEMEAVHGAKPVINRQQPPEQRADVVKPKGPRNVNRHDGLYRQFRLVAKKSNANEWEAYYRTIEFFDAATGKPLTGGRATGTGTGAADAFDDDRETKYRTLPNPGVKEDYISYELPAPAAINRVKVIQGGGDGNHVFWFEVQGSNDGKKWSPLIMAKSVQDEFDSASTEARVEWLRP